MTLEGVLSPHQVPAFYGQSVTLVSYLSRRGDPAELISFAKLALTQGYADALRVTYGIRGVGHLRRLWLADVGTVETGDDGVAKAPL